MCCMRFTMSSSYRKEVAHQLKTASTWGTCARSSISSLFLRSWTARVVRRSLEPYPAYGCRRSTVVQRDGFVRMDCVGLPKRDQAHQEMLV
jgi:hypothetical protein